MRYYQLKAAIAVLFCDSKIKDKHNHVRPVIKSNMLDLIKSAEADHPETNRDPFLVREISSCVDLSWILFWPPVSGGGIFLLIHELQAWTWTWASFVRASLFGLTAVSFTWYTISMTRIGLMEDYVRAVIRARRCPACAHLLSPESSDSRDMFKCPECGGAWSYDP